MPTLTWIGKEKVINHHHDVPYKVLNHRYSFNSHHPEQEATNKIIRGDNLEALKALLPEYEGKIKCIYIDPPYNTGKDEWMYNDKVDHPKIRKWLGQVVGKQDEDLTRHDKWLCMIYPRLVLLHKLLSEKGVIFISLDDNEVFHIKLLLNEIFGLSNYIGNIILETATDNNPRQISTEHEYILCYAKNKNKQNAWVSKSLAAEYIQSKYLEYKEKYGQDLVSIQANLRKWIRANKSSLEQVTHYDNVDHKGVYHDADVANTKFGGYVYDIVHPSTGKICKVPEKGFRFPLETMQRLIENDDILFGENEQILIKPKKRLENVTDRLRSVIYEDGRSATKELEQMFYRDVFRNPKSESVIRRLLSFSTSPDSIILDSFAGSGTTAHAVLNLNKQDGGNRKFILIEMEDYAETITAERVKRVINGYADKPGTGGSFSYYELGEPLFTGPNNEYLNEAVGIDKIKSYVWFTETRTAYRPIADQQEAFLGIHEQTAFYFIYNPNRLTALDFDTLGLVTVRAGQYIIYADNCLLPKDFLLHHHIVFKKIPRDISRL
ncbi:site-specific DNA-methyltransferase [Mucilaginibacter sp. RS28]|uniref:site-specific DNA-methyltransferase (adenine-specific) n=1 Tax=Mucilaginibacter straminoryzae TaxID=2932774 RepID=A0A9X1X6N4_9SPHI|nr:site-specific DNA-methyltransferase [Mucilaginibacter straminoryzae]MCJ8210658.1 site-specific DNA-methyltransferase [Mucilaginibacter straminoryzae]